MSIVGPLEDAVTPLQVTLMVVCPAISRLLILNPEEVPWINIINVEAKPVLYWKN
jgi:hypothetical protein